MNRSRSKTLCKFLVLSLAAFVLVVQGCATAPPAPADPMAFKDRVKTAVKEDVTVTVAVSVSPLPSSIV